MTFKVDRTPAVSRRIRELGEHAKARRVRDSYTAALETMVDHLQNRPLEWGDPEYKTKTPGGLVCRGIASPLRVRYVVFESLKIVLIFEISPLQNSLLADP